MKVLDIHTHISKKLRNHVHRRVNYQVYMEVSDWVEDPPFVQVQVQVRELVCDQIERGADNETR